MARGRGHALRVAAGLLIAGCALAACGGREAPPVEVAAPVDGAATPGQPIQGSPADGRPAQDPPGTVPAAHDAAPDDDATTTAIAATSAQCARAVSARMRRVCGSDELRRLHWANREHFALLRERFPDDAATVQQAAERQLEACPDAACLARAYRDWETYLGDNYDLFDAY